MNDDLKIKFVKRFLEGEALSWTNQYCIEGMTFAEFEEGFLSKFWSGTEQARIKSEFLNGPVNKDEFGSMKQFCKNQLRKLNHLSKPFDELTQIDALKRRLPYELQWELVYRPDDTVDQFLKYEDKLDRIIDETGKPPHHSQNHFQKTLHTNWGHTQHDKKEPHNFGSSDSHQ